MKHSMTIDYKVGLFYLSGNMAQHELKRVQDRQSSTYMALSHWKQNALH